jgi:hypothetical protein
MQQSQERPVPKVDPKQLSALLRTGPASSDAVTEVAVPEGGLLRYRKDATASISAQIEAVSSDGLSSVLLRAFRPSTSRPPEYPTAAPFLANRAVTVTESSDGLVLAWEEVPDLDGALAQLVDGSLAEGWTEDSKPGLQDFARFMGMQARTLRRGGRQRVFSVMTRPLATLTCIEGSESPAPVGTAR